MKASTLITSWLDQIYDMPILFNILLILVAQLFWESQFLYFSTYKPFKIQLFDVRILHQYFNRVICLFTYNGKMPVSL